VLTFKQLIKIILVANLIIWGSLGRRFLYLLLIFRFNAQIYFAIIFDVTIAKLFFFFFITSDLLVPRTFLFLTEMRETVLLRNRKFSLYVISV
jgi:hypothetical protein